jgi:hypothetical protein
VAIFIIHGWVGRKCEFLTLTTSNHQILWGEVDFLLVNSAKQETIMPLADILKTPCDMVRIRPRSRKHQAKGEVREIPPRVNFTKLANPADGLKIWTGDLATVMQVHYMTSQAYRNVDSVATRPVLAMLNGEVPTSASLMKKLKAMAQMYNVDPSTVVFHIYEYL